ncbi:otoancorin [Symphorus nematophorus]
MAPKGGTFFLLLIVACAALDMRPNKMPGKRPDFKGLTKRLMKKCQEKGYPVPKMEQLKPVFNISESPMEDRNSGQSNIFLSTFMNVLGSVSPVKDSLGSVPMVDKVKNKMWNCSNLPAMIKMMRNSSEASACYMHAFVAPLSWETLTTRGVDDMDSDDYDTLLWAARPALQGMPSSRMRLPDKASHQEVKKMMKMLKEVYGPMSKDQKRRVVKWAKQQITENYFNCTMSPSSNSSSKWMERCKPSLKWLNLETLMMMGPYLSSLSPDDVDSSPKEKLCEFYRSGQFMSTLRMATMMKPSLAKRFLKRIQACFNEKDFENHMDKLGALACYYDTDIDLLPKFAKKLLSQLDNCDNPGNRKLRKRLVKSIVSKSITVQVLRELGSSVALLPLKQLSKLSGKDLKEFLKTTPVQWSQAQQHILAMKQLDNKCKAMSGEELKDVQSVAGGLPICVLKQVKAQEMLNDTEALKNISKRMRKAQLKAILEGLLQGVDPSELVQKLTGSLLRSMSLSLLTKANITSLDQVKHKNWSRSQAVHLLAKNVKKIVYRKLGSLNQGLTCEMIEKVADSDVMDMVEGMADTPQPSKVKDLPDSVCTVFLDKTEVANLSSVPLRAPSRLALTRRALLCLANGTDLSGLTTEDVTRLGPLLCELNAFQLRLMAPDVLNSSLQAMASCQHIPRRHRADLIQLVNQTFGDPSDWSAETMEELGPLLLWDDNATSALPNKPWMKDVLRFLMRLPHTSTTLRKKCFDITTTSNAARKKREANSNSNGGGKGNSHSNAWTDSSKGNGTINTKAPTGELIEQLEKDNIFWTSAQLDKMQDETLRDTVETLGNVPGYSADKLAVLSKKAVKVFGPVSKMNESLLMQLRCIIRGFPEADLEQLPISLAMLDQIAHCGWNESQMESVWKSVAKYNNLTAEQLDAAEMVSLNQFICGLNSSEFRQLNMTAFKNAVGSMDGVQCSFKVAQELKSLAVSAFGNPSTWTGAQVDDLGNIIAGLDGTELASLDPSVCPFIRESCIPLIPPINFAFFTVDQLKAFEPDNAAMVTSEQRAALGDNKLAALENAITGSRNQTVPSDNSGAPSLTVEGMSAFMKPLLFLLTGFLLL